MKAFQFRGPPVPFLNLLQQYLEIRCLLFTTLPVAYYNCLKHVTCSITISTHIVLLLAVSLAAGKRRAGFQGTVRLICSEFHL